MLDAFHDTLDLEDKRIEDEPPEDEVHPDDVRPMPALNMGFLPSHGDRMRMHIVRNLF
jgi:hypothetical protein